MILIVDMNAKPDSLSYDEFVKPVLALLSTPYEVKHYTDVRKVEDYSHIILCGTPLQDNRFVEDINVFQWIKTYNLPLLGICAGMQVLALMHGSFLIPCRGFGMVEIKTLQKNPLFDNAFTAYSVHGNAINPSPWFDVLAVSPSCVEAIKHKEKPHYGVLFHPEVRNQAIITHFLSL